MQMYFYGLGGMLGAGIYGLVGKAAGQLGNAVWLAFMVSMVAALLTGLSYASIGSRYPRAAGAAYVTQRAYRRLALTYVVGLAVMCSGLTSVATQSRVVAENLGSLSLFQDMLATVLAIAFLLLMAGIVFRGNGTGCWDRGSATGTRPRQPCEKWHMASLYRHDPGDYPDCSFTGERLDHEPRSSTGKRGEPTGPSVRTTGIRLA
jgi:Amino acid permease